MATRLPPPPDFDALEAASPATADKRTRVLALIGNLTFSWANNESLFIYVVMLLLRTDEVSAALVFGTLNTTRARIDLINRLSAVKLHNQELRDELARLIKRFEAANKLRNEFNHAMYAVAPDGTITHTSSMRIEEKRGGLRFGNRRALDEKRLKELEDMVNKTRALNQDIWRFLPRLEAQMNGASGEPGSH